MSSTPPPPDRPGGPDPGYGYGSDPGYGPGDGMPPGGEPPHKSRKGWGIAAVSILPPAVIGFAIWAVVAQSNANDANDQLDAQQQQNASQVQRLEQKVNDAVRQA